MLSFWLRFEREKERDLLVWSTRDVSDFGRKSFLEFSCLCLTVYLLSNLHEPPIIEAPQFLLFSFSICLFIFFGVASLHLL